MNKKEKENVKTIQMNPEQVSLLKACGRRIDGLRENYTRTARQAGEIRDQLRMAENIEGSARQNLKQAESEFNTMMNEFATKLGYVQGQSWTFNQEDFSFTTKEDAQVVPIKQPLKEAEPNPE